MNVPSASSKVLRPPESVDVNFLACQFVRNVGDRCWPQTAAALPPRYIEDGHIRFMCRPSDSSNAVTFASLFSAYLRFAKPAWATLRPERLRRRYWCGKLHHPFQQFCATQLPSSIAESSHCSVCNRIRRLEELLNYERGAGPDREQLAEMILEAKRNALTASKGTGLFPTNCSLYRTRPGSK